jgi:riboflavin kinase/FMN adenylyltransferase
VQRWYGLDDNPADLGATVDTLGNFDGEHRGHREDLTRVVREAADRDALPVAVTFEPHPIAVLYPDRAPAAVMSLEQRLDALESVGLAAVLVIEFTREFAQQTPEEFVRGTFVDALGACAVVVGKDTRFGVRNSGDVDTLRELGGAHGFEVVALGYGQRIPSVVAGSDAVAAIDPDGRLVAVLDETRATARAKVVFAASGAGA